MNKALFSIALIIFCQPSFAVQSARTIEDENDRVEYFTRALKGMFYEFVRSIEHTTRNNGGMTSRRLSGQALVEYGRSLIKQAERDSAEYTSNPSDWRSLRNEGHRLINLADDGGFYDVIDVELPDLSLEAEIRDEYTRTALQALRRAHNVLTKKNGPNGKPINILSLKSKYHWDSKVESNIAILAIMNVKSPELNTLRDYFFHFIDAKRAYWNEYSAASGKDSLHYKDKAKLTKLYDSYSKSLNIYAKTCAGKF